MLVKHSTPEANALPLCGHIHPFLLQVWVCSTYRRTQTKPTGKENKGPGESHPSENDNDE